MKFPWRFAALAAIAVCLSAVPAARAGPVRSSVGVDHVDPTFAVITPTAELPAFAVSQAFAIEQAVLRPAVPAPTPATCTPADAPMPPPSGVSTGERCSSLPAIASAMSNLRQPHTPIVERITLQLRT